MEKLTKEEVLHVAELARLELSDLEIDKYARDLYLLLEEINKIQKIDIDGNVMISPSTCDCDLNEDVPEVCDYSSEIIKNAPNNSLNFVEVAGVFDE